MSGFKVWLLALALAAAFLLRAFRQRRCGGPVDWLLLVLACLLIGYAAAAGADLIYKLGGW